MIKNTPTPGSPKLFFYTKIIIKNNKNKNNNNQQEHFNQKHRTTKYFVIFPAIEIPSVR